MIKGLLMELWILAILFVILIAVSVAMVFTGHGADLATYREWGAIVLAALIALVRGSSGGSSSSGGPGSTSGATPTPPAPPTAPTGSA